jgi:hypothetical protein
LALRIVLAAEGTLANLAFSQDLSGAFEVDGEPDFGEVGLPVRRLA